MNNLNSVLIEGDVHDARMHEGIFSFDLVSRRSEKAVEGYTIPRRFCFAVVAYGKLAETCVSVLMDGKDILSVRVVGHIEGFDDCGHVYEPFAIVAEHIEVKPMSKVSPQEPTSDSGDDIDHDQE